MTGIQGGTQRRGKKFADVQSEDTDSTIAKHYLWDGMYATTRQIEKEEREKKKEKKVLNLHSVSKISLG